MSPAVSNFYETYAFYAMYVLLGGLLALAFFTLWRSYRKWPVVLVAALPFLAGCTAFDEFVPATMGDLNRAVDALEEQHDATWEAADDAATDAVLAGKTPGEAALVAITKGKDYAAQTEREKEEGDFSTLLYGILSLLGVAGVGTVARYKQATGRMPYASVLAAVFKPTAQPDEKPKRKRGA